jgi:hypothetical protein
MTLIAAILPVDGAPFFISDTLVSEPGCQETRILGPNGIILPARGGDYRPWRLQQKNIIVRERTFAAYAGASFLAHGVFRQLEQSIPAAGPTREIIADVAANYEADLLRHETSMLFAFVGNDGAVELLMAGSEFAHLVLEDGTECYAAGSGAESFLGTFPDLRRAAGGDQLLGENPHHMLIMQLCGLSAEFGAREAILGEFDCHFGGIVEIVRTTGLGFEKLPGATIINEVVTIDADELTLWGGNYLQYCYSDDVLVYWRFGQLRNAEALDAFGTDAFAAVIRPPHRQPSRAENDRACEKVLATSSDDSTFNVFCWNDLNNLNRRRLSVRAPDNGNFRVWRENGHFYVFRSHAFLDEIAQRFGVQRALVAHD